MEKKFVPKEVESKLYEFWEQRGLFEAKANSGKKPFTIILPPPNANGNLHMGHAMFVYEDIMIRFHKMKGYESFWLLGLDHAGIETQFVFEKQLKKQGKSRFDFDRETLFKMIWDFVMENKGTIKGQMRRLGFALDWSKERFTMDEDIVKIVYRTFKELHDKNLIYRANRLVNYCTSCGTSFSDLEVNYIERVDPLYYLKYGPFVLATVRPETKFGDTAVAVHPKDKRYQKWVGREIEVEGLIGPFKIQVVADEAVDPKFGTGAVKVTPAHDFNDYDIAQRHNLPMKQVIGFDGRLNEFTGPYNGMKVEAARKKVVEDMQAKGMIEKIDADYTHRVGTCYRCGRTLEPLPKEQWFINVRPLADKAVELVKKNDVNVFPKRFKSQLVRILENFIDWNISRQVVWGIRIPAYHCTSQNKWFVSPEKPEKCEICGNNDFEQDTDTFDTWFSSGQWPFATLQSLGDDYFKSFYPTSVMETGHDILRAWVARMIMLGHFATDDVPFRTVFLHGMVRDGKGQKMSKSKGNVINPLEKVDLYGADALRAALIFGTKEGGDVVMAEDKLVGMRNFANKIWNIGRFIYMSEKKELPPVEKTGEPKDIKAIVKELTKETKSSLKSVRKDMDHYHFSRALETMYQFLWHRLADYYVEELKDELRNGNIEVLESLKSSYLDHLVLLHPYMPFVTEAVWQVFNGQDTSILDNRV